MKIAVIHWIVNDVGGINSWTENFVLGLKQLGHRVQVYYGSYQKKLGCVVDRKVARSRRWHLLPAELLSYATESLTNQSVETLNGFDLIVFAHPSPHPTKSNMGCNNPRGWQSFYRETDPFKISVFHDRHWDRSNTWIEDVRAYVGYAHAAQHHFLDCVERFAATEVPCGWSLFPLVIPSSVSSSKIRRYIIATQWLALKNHRFLIPHLDELEIPLHSYGSGQTYHKLLPEMRKVFREDHHQDQVEVFNPDSPHIHYGHTEYRKLMNRVRKSWFSLDLSIQGMTNMTHWEPMTVGTISVMERRVQSDPFCEIPENCCLVFDLNDLLEDLNRFARMSTKSLVSIQQRSWKYIQRCACKTVASQILSQAGF